MLKDKVAIITGASRGIGRATSELFVENGAIVVNGDVSVDTNSDFFKEEGKDIYNSFLDVSNEKSVKKLVEKTIEKFGKVDILVNNAGICPPITQLVNMTDEEWNKVFQINLMGTVYCCKAVIPHMQNQKSGRIISLASIAGETGGIASSIAYSASKASIIVLTKILAKQLGSYNITVNAVAPGYIITEMTKDHKQDLSSVPLGRRGNSEEVANPIVFLASEMASYLTGLTLDINGGVYNK